MTTTTPTSRFFFLAAILSLAACERFRNNSPPENAPAHEVRETARALDDHAGDLRQNIEDTVDPPTPAERARDNAREVRDDVDDAIDRN